MKSAGRIRIRRVALLSVVVFRGLAACGTEPVEESGATADAASISSPAPDADVSRSRDQQAPEAARLFAAGADGLLHVREVELPRLPTTRGRAEALVQRIVEESGTFPAEVQVLDVFVSGRGVAVINFTLDLLEGHSGGLRAEELTVYSLSHTLVESLPAIAEVRLLVEGQETETLAGHLDLRSGFGRAPERLLADSNGGRG